MKIPAPLLAAAALALALGACSGGDSGAANSGAPSAAGAPSSASSSPASGPGAPVEAPAAASGGAAQELRPAPPPPMQSHGSAPAYSDCMSRARAAGSEDERALLARTCTRMKPR